MTLGTLLVNERMLESYVIARDRLLAPDGKMFPTTGRYIPHIELNAKF
jgi:type I protein arginine methyltransferase